MIRAFRLLGTNIHDAIEEAGFSVQLIADGVYEFGKYTDEGCDFRFEIDIGNNTKEFAQNILDFFSNFDVSTEAYKWLDKNGHGVNGAPYEMIDVYNDTMQCKFFIEHLWWIVRRFVVE